MGAIVFVEARAILREVTEGRGGGGKVLCRTPWAWLDPYQIRRVSTEDYMSYTAYWESLHQWFWSQTGLHKIQLLFLHKCPEQPSKFVEYIRRNYFMLHSLVCMFNRKQVRPFYGKKRPPNCPWKTICKKVHLTLTSVQIVILWKAEHSCEQNTLAKSKHATKIYFALAHLGLLAKFGLFFFFLQPATTTIKDNLSISLFSFKILRCSNCCGVSVSTLVQPKTDNDAAFL